MVSGDVVPESRNHRGGIRGAIRWVAGSNRRAFLFLFVLGLSLRLFSLIFIPPDVIPPNPQWETGAVSISLVERGAFADPYLIPTGPTAHMAPLWHWGMSLIYRVFGTGFVGGLVRWIISEVIAASLWAFLPAVASVLGLGREAGVLGGLAGALALGFPLEVEPAVALVMAGMVVGWAKGWGREGTGLWGCVVVGLVLGLALHLKPALLPVMLGLMLLEVGWGRGGWKRMGIVGVGILVACLPWGWRNYVAFQDFFFIRSNFGLELAVGNHPGADPDIQVMSARRSFVHPRTDLAEAERVRDMGEARYMEEKGAEAIAWIRSHPAEFGRLTLQRFFYYWGGPLHDPGRAVGYSLLTLLAILGLWLAWPSLNPVQRGGLLVPLLTYPLVYYLLAYMPRYGEPTRWVLFLLAGSVFWRVLDRGPGGSGASEDNSLG